MQPNIDLSLVIAITYTKDVIGRGNTLPWRIPSDLKRFSEITKREGVVVMGRKTWESLPEKFQPLPERHNIVLTKSRLPLSQDSTHFVSSVDEALTAVAEFGGRGCVIGGEQIYKTFLPLVRRAYVTMICDETSPIEGDAHFPIANMCGWDIKEISREGMWHRDDEYPTSFMRFERTYRS